MEPRSVFHKKVLQQKWAFGIWRLRGSSDPPPRRPPVLVGGCRGGGVGWRLRGARGGPEVR